MCCSKRKKWIIGILLLAAAVTAVGCLAAMEETASQNKGTLVRAIKDEGDMLKEKLKDGSQYLCKKMAGAAKQL